jgi:hypothetical protein
MSNTYGELIQLARNMVGFPEPQTGGTDYISNADYLLWLNDAFSHMVDKVFGLSAFIKFTVATDLSTTVEDHDSVGTPTITKDTDEYQRYKISNASSYHVFKNLTTGVGTAFDSRMVPASPDDPRYQSEFNSTADYLRYYWITDRGFYLLPHVLSQTNTILLKYRRLHVPVGDLGEQVVLDYTDAEQRGYPVHYLAYKIATEVKFFQDAERYLKEAGWHLDEFYNRRDTLDMGSAPQLGQRGRRFRREFR